MLAETIFAFLDFVEMDFVSSAKRLAGKNVSKMTYFVELDAGKTVDCLTYAMFAFALWELAAELVTTRKPFKRDAIQYVNKT